MGVHAFADCEIRPDLFELRRAGTPVPVERKVLMLLLHLVRHRDRAVARQELLAQIWAGVKVGDASLTRAVVEARRAIGDEAQKMIVTVRGIGFRFAAPVTESAAATLVRAPSSSLIGRDAALVALGAQLDKVCAGRAAFAWISGSVGMGKTRLLDELGTRAQARGLGVQAARCHETLERRPFRPWALLLDGIVREGDDTGAASVARAVVESGAPTLRTFESVVQALATLGRARPRLFVFDDLQWADEATLELLRFAVRESLDAPVFFACAARDAARADDPGSRTAALLPCEFGWVHVRLRGLSPEETAELIRARTGVEPSRTFERAVHERTSGCPMFVQQLLDTEWAGKALADEARSIATSIEMNRSLAESVARHLEVVAAQTRDLLRWAAVLGGTFALPTLGRVAALDRDAIIDRLDEARAAHLVQRTPRGEYRFVHPLVADALRSELSASERATRHRAVASVLAEQHAAALDLHAAEIARHLLHAAPLGAAREAYEFGVRAARHALASGDAHGAAKQWRRALRALDLLPASEAIRLGALVELSQVYLAAQELDRARDALVDGAVLAQALGRAEEFVEAALQFANLAATDDPRRLALLTEARATAERCGGPVAATLTRRIERAGLRP